MMSEHNIYDYIFMFFIFYFLFFMYNFYSFFNCLLILESISLLTIIVILSFTLMWFSLKFSLFYFIFVVCESSLGLSILVKSVKFFGVNSFRGMNILLF
uniref:NADH dehydrogenase subunit 4L n=1 Tax=Taeniothrips tigris TaxID=2824824 RepID=A0A8A9WN36_9NEOP|nr:NADH dehydrogenase subunit 4L [Taeniothrips tigris]QTT60733.1 NADH dehydrogenase subunit 4L [Taeniothrips tigris]